MSETSVERPIRHIHTLLKIVRKELVNDKEFEFGICRIVNNLFYYAQITPQEKDLLFSYLNQNAPRGRFGTPGYWWTPGKKLPRYIWLTKHIIYTY